jgi:hypothetical protein
MLPDKRVKQALLNVEKRQLVDDLSQINAAILHLLSGGKDNYDTAKKLNRKEEYSNTSDQILSDLERRRQEKESRLRTLSDELALLDTE